MNGMVSMRDYDGIQGFGTSTQQDVDEMKKALSAGVQYPPTSGGNALRVESLEATLRIVTSTLAHLKLWPMIPKLPAFNTVEEYNRLTAYGADAGAFTNEGDLPETQDSTYERKAAYVKFLGCTREVSHPMTMVRPAHGNVIALETQNGTQWLLERLERALFNGRSDNVTQEIDGLFSQVLSGVSVNTLATDLYDATDVLKVGAETVIIDKHGAPLLENDISQGANNIVEHYGIPTNVFLAPRAMKDLSIQFYPRERVNLPAPVNGQVGFAVTSMVTDAGLVQFNPDIFLRSGRNEGVKTVPAAATSAKAPLPPTTAVSASAGGDAKSMFKAGDTGTFYWVVTQCNRFGESTGTASSTQAVAAGESVAITITDATSTYPTTYYKIYRGTTVANAKYLTTIPKGGATTVFTDRNWYMPGTSMALMLQNNMQNYAVRQLAPMMKIPLATIAASIRWMQLLYLAAICYTPLKNTLYINVQDD